MINRVTLIGNLGADPEVRRLESGVAVARIRIATTESFKNQGGEWQERTEWHTINLWRGLAERAEKSLKKGMLIFVEGKLSTRQYTDKDNITRYSTEITANYYRILNRRDGIDGGNSPQRTESANVGSQVEHDANSSDDGDDLPF